MPQLPVGARPYGRWAGRSFRTTDVRTADKGYEGIPNYVACSARNVLPIIPRRVDARHKNALPLFADGSRNGAWIPHRSERFKTLYKRRSAVEREFGRLKHEYGLAVLRVRGIERVRLPPI